LWVFDRYYESNLGHQGAKFKDSIARQKMIDYLLNLELNEMRLPPSDLVIYLSLPLDYIIKAKTNDNARAGIKDLHEDDIEHLKAAKETYDMLATQLNWTTIDCYNAVLNDRYSKEDIQSKVFAAVLDHLYTNYIARAAQ
jgi:thymidylate kinase